MTETERIIIALLAGIVSGAVTYAASYVLKTPVLWPGALVSFALATIAFLFVLPRK